MHFKELPTPAVVVDLDVVEKNLDRMTAACRHNRVALRPHAKTHKTLEVARMQLERGAIGITVAKVGEAQALLESEPPEILVAHPILGRDALRRLAQVAQNSRVLVALDSEYAAHQLSQAAVAFKTTFGVLIEFNAGTHRCGVSPGPALAQLGHRVQNLPALQCRGLMTYFGNVWGTPSERDTHARETAEAVEQAIETFTSAGLPLDIVSGGSTPSALMPGLLHHLTEIRPGTYVFNDMNTYHQQLCTLQDCAVRVVTTVVSTAVPGRAIIDAGSKALSSDLLGSGPRSGYGYVPEHPEVCIEKLNEEHGYLGNIDGAELAVGDVVSIIPNHVCTTINMHDEVFITRNQLLIGTWKIAARGKVR